MISLSLCILRIDTYTSVFMHICMLHCQSSNHSKFSIYPIQHASLSFPLPLSLARLCIITYLLSICLSVMYVQDSHLSSTLHNSICIRGFQKSFLGLSFMLSPFFLYASHSLQHSEINMPAGAGAHPFFGVWCSILSVHPLMGTLFFPAWILEPHISTLFCSGYGFSLWPPPFSLSSF